MLLYNNHYLALLLALYNNTNNNAKHHKCTYLQNRIPGGIKIMILGEFRALRTWKEKYKRLINAKYCTVIVSKILYY